MRERRWVAPERSPTQLVLQSLDGLPPSTSGHGPGDGTVSAIALVVFVAPVAYVAVRDQASRARSGSMLTPVPEAPRRPHGPGTRNSACGPPRARLLGCSQRLALSAARQLA